MNRRQLLKYVGATAVAASVLVADYLFGSRPTTSNSTLTSLTTNSPSAATSAPSIENIQWTPTRTQNGKVYDGRITFQIKNPASLEAELDFQPYTPPQIPTAAFSSEASRTFSLKGVSNASKPLALNFAQEITGLKGGRTYYAIAKAYDSAGNEVSAYIETPYVREFENIAGTSAVHVGAHYEPFFRPNTWNRAWNSSNGTPLLGQYDSSDDTVISKQIDWATGYGLEFFTLDWYGPESVNYVDGNVQKITKNQLVGDVKFLIMFDSNRLESTGGVWNMDSANQAILRSDLAYIAQTYFPHPSYLKLNGRPMLYLYASGAWHGDVKGTLDMLRDVVKGYGYDPFFVGDPVQYLEPDPDRITPFDAITQWINYSSTSQQIDQEIDTATDSNYDRWSSMAAGMGVGFIPSTVPGFHKIIDPSWPVLERSTDQFASQIEVAKKYIDPQLNMVFITTFNDWTEDTEVEPGVEDGFSYLQLVRDKLVAK